jgi:hypothetical protein
MKKPLCRSGFGTQQLGNRCSRESDDAANEQERDEVSEVNPSRCEEHIGAEVRRQDLTSLKHCE